MPELVPPSLGQSSKIAPPNPAAGAEIDYTADLAARYHILSVNFTLTADANVANRYTTIQIMLSTDNIIQVGDGNLAIAASDVYTFSLYPGANNAKDTHSFIITKPISPLLYVSGKFRITTLTNGIQVGDQYSAISVWVARWLEPA